MEGKFKLITGLGCKDADKIKNLVLLYAKAGADIFDVAPSVLLDLQKFLKQNKINLNDYEFCTSISVEGDIHGKKAKINKNLCKNCGECEKKCKQDAIKLPFIDEKKCIGCSHCYSVCKYGAIEFFDDVNNDFDTLLKQNVKLDTVEIHISIKDKKQIIKEFKKIIKKLEHLSCKISVCFNRTFFSNSKTAKILSKLKEISKGHDFVVQADGNSMNNGKDTLAGTLETVAFGLFVKSLGYEVVLSGGCNSYTAKLAKDSGLKCSIGFGSFARNLVSTLNDNEVLICAKEFVKKTKEELND